jgi:hypothetical protein
VPNDEEMAELRAQSAQMHGETAAKAALAFYDTLKRGSYLSVQESAALTEAWLKGGMGPATQRTEFIHVPARDPLTR